MYMRLVQAKSKPGLSLKIQQVYDEKIIPQLRKMPGCLCSCLIQNESHIDEGISMTLWDSQIHAEAYEQSGLFQKLLDEVKPYLSDSSEWKIQLSKELQLEYQPVPDEPVLKAYTSFVQSDSKIVSESELSLMHVRILSLKIKAGKMEEFGKIYEEKILPALRGVKGCQYAFMTKSMQEETEALSVTIWNSKEDAINYESSELFNELLDTSKDTFLELFQWKMGLEKETAKKVVTSEDAQSEFYTIVAGKSFRASGTT